MNANVVVLGLMNIKKEFTGKLKKIDPRKLINEKNRPIENFFLILALIFNDLKGLVFYRKLLDSSYRVYSEDEISVHSGEYAGLIIQNNKLIISLVCEFIEFIDKNRSNYSEVGFQVVLKNIDPRVKKMWLDLISLDKSENSLFSKISRIRSNVAFHYDHSSTQMRDGFIKSFYGDGSKYEKHKHAYYYSDEGKMETTRFFYADAAAEEYIKSLLAEDDMKEVSGMITEINFVIQNLLREYYRNK